MRTHWAIAMAVAAIVVFTVLPSLSAPPRPPAAVGTAAKVVGTTKAKTPITVKAAEGMVIKGDQYEFRKPVILYKDIVVRADKGLFDKAKSIGRFTGQVQVTQPGIKLSCSALEARFSEDKVLASGGVTLVREENRKDTKGKVTKVLTRVTGTSAEFSTATQDFTVSGNVYIEDRDFKVWAAKAAYTDKDKKLVLTGQVRVHRPSDGSKVNAEKVTYYTQTENIEVLGAAEVLTFID